MLNSLIEKVKNKNDLDKNDLNQLINLFFENKFKDSLVKELIKSWYEKGYASDEVYNMVNILFEHEPQINLSDENVIDVCGTGGDKLNTFNISTLTAIVAAAAGVKVIKHSGRSSTSVSGSVDVLEEVGIPIDLEKSIQEEIFKKYNLMFVASNILRKAFSRVKVLAKDIGVPSFVNLLGPVSNPYKTNGHVLGVSNILWAKTLCEVSEKQNKKNVLIVCSRINENQFLDELSFVGNNIFWEKGQTGFRKHEKDFNVLAPSSCSLDSIVLKNKNQAKEVFLNVLRGNKDYAPMIETVALNAGSVLYIAKISHSIEEGYKKALDVIYKDYAWEHFQNILKLIQCI